MQCVQQSCAHTQTQPNQPPSTDQAVRIHVHIMQPTLQGGAVPQPATRRCFHGGPRHSVCAHRPHNATDPTTDHPPPPAAYHTGVLYGTPKSLTQPQQTLPNHRTSHTADLLDQQCAIRSNSARGGVHTSSLLSPSRGSVSCGCKYSFQAVAQHSNRHTHLPSMCLAPSTLAGLERELGFGARAPCGARCARNQLQAVAAASQLQCVSCDVWPSEVSRAAPAEAAKSRHRSSSTAANNAVSHTQDTHQARPTVDRPKHSTQKHAT